MPKWFDKIVGKQSKSPSWVRNLLSGSLYKISDVRSGTDIADIRSQIDVMRALARDSQIGMALSYYATDTTTTNSKGQMIWATPTDAKAPEAAEIVNALIKEWKVTSYARDHILELATVGNLYIPTSTFYAKEGKKAVRKKVVIDNNTIRNDNFKIIPSTKIPPEDIIHLWQEGEPQGYVFQPDEKKSEITTLPEDAVIHFSLGGLIGDYKFEARNKEGEDVTYDIQFSTPLLANVTQPTQTLNLIEDALLLSSLVRTVKFINVDCGDETEDVEIRNILQQIKDSIEQQLSLNTNNGTAESYVNPQSPNNLIYLPKVKGQDAVSVTDLNMAEANQADNNLLDHYLNKKLSVLGIPKEALNFSSNEGLGGAGAVMSQRSALYANILLRIEAAYVAGWTQAFATYFKSKNLSGMCDKFTLHMNPILTEMSTIQQDRRDAALNQAQLLIQIMKDLGIKDSKSVKQALVEILRLVFPELSSEISNWHFDFAEGSVDNGGEV